MTQCLAIWHNVGKFWMNDMDFNTPTVGPNWSTVNYISSPIPFCSCYLEKQNISFWQSWFPAFLFIPYECVAGSFRKWNCCGFSRFQPLLEGDWKPKASGSFLIETTKIMHDFQSRVWTCGYVICGYVITISKHVHQHLSPRTLSWTTQQKTTSSKKTPQQPLDAPTTHALHIFKKITNSICWVAAVRWWSFMQVQFLMHGLRLL